MFLTTLFTGHLQDAVLERVIPGLKRLRTCEKDVRVWKQHREIPLIGWILRSQAGRPRGFAKLRNDLIVRASRSFTQTKTFEHAIAISCRDITPIKMLKRRLKPTHADDPWIDPDVRLIRA
jgi:hypothetical protein